MKHAVLLLAGLGLAATLTACGGDDDSDFESKSGEDIAEASKDAMADLTSMRVAGSITNDDQQIDIDLRVGSGGDCTGTLGIEGGTTELLGVDGQTWMRPDEAFWTAFAGDSAEQLISMVGDKWVVIPSEGDSFNQFCDLDELLDEMLKDDDEDDSTYTTKDTSEIDGEDVVAVENKGDDGTSTGYVLLDSPHYLVKIERTSGDDAGSVTFSEFDADLDVAAPAADEVVDLDNMAG